MTKRKFQAQEYAQEYAQEQRGAESAGVPPELQAHMAVCPECQPATAEQGEQYCSAALDILIAHLETAAAQQRATMTMRDAAETARLCAERGAEIDRLLGVIARLQITAKERAAIQLAEDHLLGCAKIDSAAALCAILTRHGYGMSDKSIQEND